MAPKRRSQIITSLKIIGAVSLTTWLIKSDKLDLNQLSIFIHQPTIVVWAVFHFLSVGLILGGLRWHLLLRGVDIRPKLSRTFSLQATGLFFNTVLPGAVGGDLAKGVYIVRDQKEKSKSRAMITILLDRVSGMMGLFTLGGLSIAFNFAAIWQQPVLRSLALLVLALLALMVLMHLFVFVPIAPERDIFLRLFRLNIPGFSIAQKIYLALRAYHEQPRILILAWLLSVAGQIITMGYFWVITSMLLQKPFNLYDFATVFPLGILTSALPLAPGGIGVGHVAFERLFDLVHIGNGANIFNIYVLGYLTLSLTGSIPYIFLRSTDKNPPLPSPENDEG